MFISCLNIIFENYEKNIRIFVGFKNLIFLKHKFLYYNGSQNNIWIKFKQTMLYAGSVVAGFVTIELFKDLSNESGCLYIYFFEFFNTVYD